jgi:hypothetical protein
MGLVADAGAGRHAIEKGWLQHDRSSSAALSRRSDDTRLVRAPGRRDCEAAGISRRETSYLVQRRGRYAVASGPDESLTGDPHAMTRRFINLLDGRLPFVDSVPLSPGSRHLLPDLDRMTTPGPAVLASACKTFGAAATADGVFRFDAEGPEGIEAAIRVAVPAPPTHVELDGSPLNSGSWIWDP